MSKCEIMVILEDSGEIKYTATSKNLITILGLIEIAKKGFTEKICREQETLIKPVSLN